MPADLPTKGRLSGTQLAGNSYFPHGRIFIPCFSEPLDINIEILNGLLLWKPLFIQIHFGGVWLELKIYSTYVCTYFIWDQKQKRTHSVDKQLRLRRCSAVCGTNRSKSSMILFGWYSFLWRYQKVKQLQKKIGLLCQNSRNSKDL